MTWNIAVKMMPPVVFGAALFALGCNKNGSKSSIETEKPITQGPVEEEKPADEGDRLFGGSNPENRDDVPRREERDQEEEIENIYEEKPIEEHEDNEDEVVKGYELRAGAEVI